MTAGPESRRRSGRSRARPPEIILHLGAQRTGSTRLQYILDSNRDALATNATVALTAPRPGKRASPTIRDVVAAALAPTRRFQPLERYLNRRRARAMLQSLIADRMTDAPLDKIIVSDETMLGPAFRADGRGLYPQAYARLATLRRLLGRPPCAVHLTLRGYDTFIVSVYAMTAVYRGDVPPFDDIRETLLTVHRGWPEVVDDVVQAFPATRVKLTRVEHDPMEDRIRDLVGSEVLRRFRLHGNERMNAAPTIEAIAAAGGSGQHKELDELVARNAHGAKFDPLTQEERMTLTQRYAQDIAVLGFPPPATPVPR